MRRSNNLPPTVDAKGVPLLADKPEGQAEAQWVCNCTGQILTLAKLSPKGYLLFEERPGTAWHPKFFTPNTTQKSAYDKGDL